MADGFVRATGCDAHAGTRRVPPATSTSSHTFFFLKFGLSEFQIWTEGVLVEHRAPVVRRCNPALFRSKTDWTLLTCRFLQREIIFFKGYSNFLCGGPKVPLPASQPPPSRALLFPRAVSSSPVAVTTVEIRTPLLCNVHTV